MTSWVDVFREVRHGGSGKGLLPHYRPASGFADTRLLRHSAYWRCPAPSDIATVRNVTPNGRPHETCTSAVVRARDDVGRGARAGPERWRRGGVRRSDFHARGRFRASGRRRAAGGGDRRGYTPRTSP